MPLQPGPVRRTRLAPRDDPKALGTEADDRKVAFDAAALVQHRGVDDLADRFVDVVGGQGLQKSRGAWPAYLELGESAEIG
jgi:hypothetical protein